jgi:regulator of replication initiation timing
MDEFAWHSSDRVDGDEGSSLATSTLVEEGTTVTDVFGDQSADQTESGTAVEPEDIFAEFDGLSVQLRTGAETVGHLRNRVAQLFELSVETSHELDRHREQLAAGEEAQRHDRETISRLQEQLTHRTQALEEMKTKLGDLIRDFETLA